MTSNNPTGRTRGIWHVRDVHGDEITVTANPQHQTVDVETEHALFSFDMQAAHRLAARILQAAEQVMGGEQQ